MHWSDEGIILGARPHGETSVILELMTRDHGRHLGVVHGGQSRRVRPVLQAGNGVAVTWRARLDEHLGHYTVEPERPRSATLIGSPLALHGLGTLALHLRLLPERDPHPALFEALGVLLDRLADRETSPALFVRFELMLLAELGYGLDLASCAATGTLQDLVYVSPKSGRAVCREAGEPYRGRLLPLPSFLLRDATARDGMPEDVEDGFRLTEFFLAAHIYGPQGRALPEERARFVAEAARRQVASSGMVPAASPGDSGRNGTP